MPYRSVNPVTGGALKTFPEHTDEQMWSALAKAGAKRVASRMETGMVFINYPDVSLPELPFGGVKRSGYGKELSSLGIEEFVNRKLIFVPNANLGA